MRSYETTFIISGSISDANREAIIERYEKVLTNNGADFKRTVRWGKRQLAYPIKKQNRGYYVIFYYDAEPAIINPMHREMDLNELILRYMTLVSDGEHPDYIRDEGAPSDVTPVEPVVETPAEDEEIADAVADENVEADEAADDAADEAADDDTAKDDAGEEAAEETETPDVDASTDEAPEEPSADDADKEVE